MPGLFDASAAGEGRRRHSRLHVSASAHVIARRRTGPRARPTATSDGGDVGGPEDADPIVFVHGAAFTRAMWVPQRGVLDYEFRVVVPALPAHGVRSDVDFRPGTAVDAHEDAVEEHADGSAHLVGLSLGGCVGTADASRRPETVDGLVLSGSSANPADSLAALIRGIGDRARLAARSERIENGLSDRWVRKRSPLPDREREIVDAGLYPVSSASPAGNSPVVTSGASSPTLPTPCSF